MFESIRYFVFVLLISLVFEDTKIEQDIYQAIHSSFPRRIKFRAKQIFITDKL